MSRLKTAEPAKYPDPSAYAIGSLQSRAAARAMLEARRRDTSNWSDEKLIHDIARLSAHLVGGGNILVRADYLAFEAEIEGRKITNTPADWGYIEALALGRDMMGYGPGATLDAVEVLPDSIIPIKAKIHESIEA